MLNKKQFHTLLNVLVGSLKALLQKVEELDQQLTELSRRNELTRELQESICGLGEIIGSGNS